VRDHHVWGSTENEKEENRDRQINWKDGGTGVPQWRRGKIDDEKRGKEFFKRGAGPPRVRKKKKGPQRRVIWL